jgi:hypothetical protein
MRVMGSLQARSQQRSNRNGHEVHEDCEQRTTTLAGCAVAQAGEKDVG